jgi:hypothetical protein
VAVILGWAISRLSPLLWHSSRLTSALENAVGGWLGLLAWIDRNVELSSESSAFRHRKSSALTVWRCVEVATLFSGPDGEEIARSLTLAFRSDGVGYQAGSTVWPIQI